jgi:putative spermidine/putrescine transport system substrate-binding protein
MSKELIFVVLASILALSACVPAPSTSAAQPAASQPTVVEQVPVLNPVEGPADAPAPPGYEGKSWADIVAEARGQTVNFYMWGGSDVINGWVTGYVAQNLKERYGITLVMTPVADAPEFINKILGEKQAGRDVDGSVDLMWVNGENFRTLRQGDLAYGPWSRFLPNSAYVNWDDASVANDFGAPVDGYESPYGKAQFVMIYDSAKLPEPPKTVNDLLAWIKANPGQFTYAAPPDFTGSAFVRHVCYATTGGYQQFMGDFDQAAFDAKFSACWQALNEIEPALWRGGQTYPENRARMQDLFANGEVLFDMAYNPAEASSLIAQGRYPATTRTFVFEEGTIANTHYVAIPYNSPHKAAAMVVADFLLSPEAQLSKADPTGWGDLPVLDPARLPADWQKKFSDLPRGPATLPDVVLASHRLPELPAAWITAIEKGWEANVLQR